MSDAEAVTRCVKASRWYLAGRWRPGQCFLVAGHPGEHSGAPALVDWSPERAWMLAAKHGLPGGDPGPWRFDVPEVPAHVTAFRSRTGVVWVRGLIGPRRQQWAIWSDSTETVEVLDMLGLLPPSPTKLTGPRAVVCPTCAAVVGRPCTQNGGRDRYQRIHVARTKAAREAL